MSRPNKNGFAAVDAIVALTLLALTLAFCVQAGLATAEASRTAADLRRAEAVSRHALVAPPRATYSDGAGGLDWRVDVSQERALAANGLVLCRRYFVASDHRRARKYQWQAVSPCPREEPTP